MNCLIVDDEEMSRNVIKHFIEQTTFLNLVGVCNSALEASNFINKEKIDVLFLDIEMPEMTGYELIDTFLDTPIQIILISGKKEYAVEAFNYDVADFILKPLVYSRFLKAVSKAQGRLNQFNTTEIRLPKELYVRSDSKVVRVEYNDITHVEALADYVIVYTQDQKLIVHATMKGFQSRLPQDRFVRVHRSYIINVEKIEFIENLFVIINKKHIPIGASYKDDFMKKLNLF